MIFEVENLPHPQAGHTGFQCITDIEGANMRVPARVDSNRFIVCEKRIVSISNFIRKYVMFDKFLLSTITKLILVNTKLAST